MDAIVYTTNTGFTEQYARLLAKRVALPVFSLKEARVKLRRGASVIYMGWLMGGMVRGYKVANRRYHVRAVCGVGMGKTGSQIEDVRKANGLDAATPVFTLQGGLDVDKLRGVYKFMMKAATGAKVKRIAEKQDVSPEDADALEMIRHGGNRVSEEALSDLLAWYASAQ